MPELEGKWLGKIIYGHSFGELENEALIFTLNLSRTGDEFSGTSIDVDGIGINPNHARIKGFMDEDSINFVKQYTLPPKLGLNQKLVDTDTNKLGPEISFTGIFNPATGEYSGEWIILISFNVLGNVFFEKDNGGWWSMKREVLQSD